MRHPHEAVVRSFSQSQEDALRKIMESFQGEGFKKIATQMELHSEHTDEDTDGNENEEAGTLHVVNKLKDTYDHIQLLLKEHYPDFADQSAYQDVWAEIRRLYFPSSPK